MKKLFKRADLIVIAAVAVLSLILLIPNLFGADTLTAQIIVDGEIMQEIDLGATNERYTVTPKEGTVITVEGGRIRFSSACCKDGLCVNSGWLTAKGQTAACLPEKIVISIKGTDKTDMMTY